MKKITLLFLLISGYTFGQTFTDATGSLPQLTNSFAAWGDYDGDGDLDLYLSGELNTNSNGGGLYQNDNGNFTLVANSGLPLLSHGAADWGDFDGDGDLDLALMGYDGNTGFTDIYVNNGNNTFTALNAGLPQVYMGDIHFADLNNDGVLDIGLTGYDLSNSVNLAKLYLNQHNNFTEISSTVLPPIYIGKMAFADFDNDNDTDFVISGMNNTTSAAYTKIWQNDGSGNFTEQNFSLPQVWLGDVAWGDVDNDGKLDLVITGTALSDSEAHLMLNNGSSFTDDSHFNITAAQRNAGLELTDFDGDGSIDIFITGVNVVGSNETFIAKLYNNNGAGIFTENTNNTFVAVNSGEADAADYDQDGKPDLLITGTDNNNFGATKLYHNGPISAIDQNLAEKFTIFPNPAHNHLYIQNKKGLIYKIKITDLTGKIVYVKNSNEDVNINVSGFTAGIYLIKISNNQNSFTKKLLIK